MEENKDINGKILRCLNCKAEKPNCVCGATYYTTLNEEYEWWE